MQIDYISYIDLPGSSFNGHDLQIELNSRGHISYQFVMEQQGDNPNTICVAPTPEYFMLHEYCREFEEATSLHALIYPFGKKIMISDEFITTDIVHCHLIHNGIISLYDLEEMSKIKPVVWTLHDPWAFTGHCVHPIDCDQWQTGCKKCQYLDRHFPLKKDNSALLWNIKKKVYTSIDVDIVVASQWMKRLVEDSPLTSHFKNVHLIPFGINIDVFSENLNRQSIREQLGIPNESFVLFFRPQPSFFKGLDTILGMLDILQPTKPVVLLTVGYGEFPLAYKKMYKTIELGWVNNDRRMADLYCACDVFLMPSIAESFGLMAIEAMASGRPIVVMEGTALPDVTFAPDCGICISKNNAVAELKEVVERLMLDPDECRTRGKKGRELAEKHYRFEDYVNKHIQLYEEILKRKGKA